MLKLPGLIDSHVHVRDPGQTHKEDWDTATQAALAGGFTAILAMPNTIPPIFDRDTLDLCLSAAKLKARCDYAQFLGAGPKNASAVAHLATEVAGLKMYLNSTFGELRLNDKSLWIQHFEKIPQEMPIVLHAEGQTMIDAILIAKTYEHPVHIAHVSLKEEILAIKAAKERGIKVTCEVTPHHLFMTKSSPLPEGEGVGVRAGRQEVRPRLASKEDVDALWDNLDVIDVFATDHAPHTLAEKDGKNPPPGFPGLETALPLLLTAMNEGRLTLDDIVEKMHTNPKKIFNLPEQKETWVEVDENASYELRASNMHSRCGWTPFEGMQVKGRVTRVVLRGKEAYKDGMVLAEKGSGLNLRRFEG